MIRPEGNGGSGSTSTGDTVSGPPNDAGLCSGDYARCTAQRDGRKSGRYAMGLGQPGQVPMMVQRSGHKRGGRGDVRRRHRWCHHPAGRRQLRTGAGRWDQCGGDQNLTGWVSPGRRVRVPAG